MADDNEDQWLYGDSVEGKEYTSTNTQSENQQNDSTFSKAQEKSYSPKDQKVDNTDETLSEVCA